MIKTRAWDKRNKQFVYGRLDDCCLELDFESKKPFHGSDLEPWELWTGHKANGVEIYEGDRVHLESQYDTDEPVDTEATVVFMDGAFRLDFHAMLLTGKIVAGVGNWRIEVIGHKHQVENDTGGN